MEKSVERDLYFEETASIFKLMASPIRLRLIHYISFCPRTVEECSEKLSISIQNVSLHLVQLAKAGVLEVEKIKNYRYYSLGKNPLAEIITEAMKSDSRDIMPSGTKFNDSVQGLVTLINSNDITLIDLRSEEESRYITVKRSIPFHGDIKSLKAFLKELPSKQLIFFCKGRLCERLAMAMDEATRLGIKAKALCLTASELQSFSSQIH